MMKKYVSRHYFTKKIILFIAVILMIASFPVQVSAAGKNEPPALPYEKTIYKNGSWFTLWDSDQLIFGYDGRYEIDQALFINDKTGANISYIPPLEFRINTDQIISAITLPYIYYPVSEVESGHIEPVYVELEDSRGNMYGPYLMEGMERTIASGSRNDFTDEEIREQEETAAFFGDDNEPRRIGAKPVPYTYTFRPEGELRLPRGKYTLHTSDSENLVRTKNSGLEGPVFIKGYEGSAYDKYKEKLLLWNMKNNPELFESTTVIRELVDGEEVESNTTGEEEYTILGNMELFEYREEQDEGKKEYPIQERAESPPAEFPLYLSLPAPALIDEIVFNTYNDGLGAPPGTVTITGVNDGEDYGTFQASGATLQGTPNGMWIVSPGITLPAGEYRVDVSDESVVASIGDGRPDFYIGATPPPPIDHDFSGTYLINVTTQKTGSIGLGIETGESEDTFSLSSHPITILDKGDHILLIASYDGMTISRKCPAGSRTLDSLNTFLEFSLDLSGTPAKTTISAAVDIFLSKPEKGVATMTIGGNASYARETTEEEGGDFNTYQVAGSGIFAGQDISPAVLPFMGLGMASAGSIPGPDNPGQAAVGVLFPPLATVLIGLLESMFRRKDEVLSHVDLPLETYDFGDGRKYQEGSTYTFDDGGEYIVKNGEFEFVRQLGDGDRYTNPDGDSKVWIGGQPWQASDWQAQDATNREYAQAHAQDWEDARSSPDKYMEEAFAEIARREKEAFDAIQLEIDQRRREHLAQYQERLEREMDYAHMGTGAGRILGDTVINTGDDFVQLGRDIHDLGREALDIGWEVLADPSILTNTFKGSLKDIQDGLTRAIEDLGQAASDLYKYPEILSHTLAGTGRDIVSGAADGLEALGQAASDVYKYPEIIVDTLIGSGKDITGYSNYVKSLDPNLSLGQRIGQSLTGSYKMWSSIKTIGTGVDMLKNKMGISTGGGASTVRKIAGKTSVVKPGDAKAMKAFRKAQMEGKSKVDNYISALKSKDPQRIKKAAMSIQGDNQAIANINGRNNFIKNQFNRTMKQNYNKVDERVIKKLAKEYGVDSNKIKVVSATNPNKSLINVKVGYDRDITFRVGNKDIPAKKLQSIYNEEFRRVTGADPTKLGQQAVDRMHAEAYGRQASDLHKAMTGRAHKISDSAQVGKTISYKGHQSFKKAAEVLDLGRSQREMFDGIRQVSKQWNNQIKSAIEYASKNPGKLGSVKVPYRLNEAMKIMDQIHYGASPVKITQQLRGLGMTPADAATQAGDFFDAIVRLGK